jgi:hypothetical protein
MAKGPIAALGKDLNAQFKAGTGMDVGNTVSTAYQQKLANVQQERTAAKYDVVMKTVSEMVPINGNKVARERRTFSEPYLAERGTTREGTTGDREKSISVRVVPNTKYSEWAWLFEQAGAPQVAAAGG